MGSLIAFAILSFVFLITSIRNATKTNKEKLTSKRMKRDVVTTHVQAQQVSHGEGVRVKLPSIGEQLPDDYGKCSISEHYCNVKNTSDVIKHNVARGETDIGLDVVQDLINNRVKPSFMVHTQDGS